VFCYMDLRKLSFSSAGFEHSGIKIMNSLIQADVGLEVSMSMDWKSK
jgi:hypothetical protein